MGGDRTVVYDRPLARASFRGTRCPPCVVRLCYATQAPPVSTVTTDRKRIRFVTLAAACFDSASNRESCEIRADRRVVDRAQGEANPVFARPSWCSCNFPVVAREGGWRAVPSTASWPDICAIGGGTGSSTGEWLLGRAAIAVSADACATQTELRRVAVREQGDPARRGERDDLSDDVGPGGVRVCRALAGLVIAPARF